MNFNRNSRAKSFRQRRQQKQHEQERFSEKLLAIKITHTPRKTLHSLPFAPIRSRSPATTVALSIQYGHNCIHPHFCLPQQQLAAGSGSSSSSSRGSCCDRQKRAHLGLRCHTLRDRRQLQWPAQGALQAGHAPLGELHVHQVCGARCGNSSQLYCLYHTQLRVS